MIFLILFWTAFSLITYHYFLFILLTFILAAIRRKAVDKKDVQLKVSLVIAAYNEEKVIEKKIQNTMELDYPKDLLEIIIVSDGSTDSTPKIVEQHKDQGVISIFSPPRRGKTSALNRALKVASGEVVVFSDANSMYDKKAIKMLVRNFNDPSVGGATGRKSIIMNQERESSRGDKLFWDIESQLKMKQSQIGSITTGDGEIFAIRRELYTDIPENIINDDTAITFNIVNKGYRVVYEPEAISMEEASIVLKDDFNVKVRMVYGGYQTLSFFSDMLFPPRDYFTFQFLSHKLLRWIMPVLLIVLFMSNLFLNGHFYMLFLFLQLGFFATALIGYGLKTVLPSVNIFYVPLYYCSMTIAALYGLFAFIKGSGGVGIWKKASR